jgi:uncharacterized membrane protein
MSIAIFLGFIAFVTYSFHAGITKETVYVGPVGAWLIMYTLYSWVVSFVCVLLILWMAAKRRKSWRLCAATFASAWVLTLLAYVAWHYFAQSQYLLSA